MKKLHNSIEHHKSQMNLVEVDTTTGRLMAAVVEFDKLNGGADLADAIDPANYEVFEKLASRYEVRHPPKVGPQICENSHN